MKLEKAKHASLIKLKKKREKIHVFGGFLNGRTVYKWWHEKKKINRSICGQNVLVVSPYSVLVFPNVPPSTDFDHPTYFFKFPQMNQIWPSTFKTVLTN